MKMEKVTKWDPVDYLDSPEAISAYMDAALEDGDSSLIAAVLGDIARAKGMSSIAKETGLARENLYKSLSDKGNPELSTFLKVIKALGYHLELKQNTNIAHAV
jgi:probable addiction module antidote protein